MSAKPDTTLRDQDARAERDRIQRRTAFLVRKAQRLPLRSNGRRQALAQAVRLGLLDQLIGQALDGGRPPKRLMLGAGRHEQRAAATLSTFHAAT